MYCEECQNALWIRERYEKFGCSVNCTLREQIKEKYVVACEHILNCALNQNTGWLIEQMKKDYYFFTNKRN